MNIKKIVTLIVTATTFALGTASLANADAGAGDPGRQAAFKGCAAANNVSLPIQGKLDKTQREAMKSCMTKAGYSFHYHHHHWKKIKACVEAKGVQLPAFTPGQKPTLTPEQQAAVDSCKTELKAAWKAKHAASTSSTGSTGSSTSTR